LCRNCDVSEFSEFLGLRIAGILLELPKFSISRLEPEFLNTFQENLIYLLINWWPFNFLPVFHATPLPYDGGVEQVLHGDPLFYESNDYGMLEQQHDQSCILSLVLSYFSLIMQRDG